MKQKRRSISSLVESLIEEIALINETMQQDVATAENALEQAPDVPEVTMQQLREEQITPAQRRLDAANIDLERAKAQGMIRGILAFKERGEVKDAQANFNQQKMRLDADEQVRLRAAMVESQGQKRAIHRERRQALQTLQMQQGQISDQVKVIAIFCDHMSDAIERGGWAADDALKNLVEIVMLVKSRKLIAAGEKISAVRFQRLPPQKVFDRWKETTVSYASKIRQKSVGYVALAPFPGLTEPSLELAKLQCRQPEWRSYVSASRHPSDQWLALAPYLTDPASPIEQVHWIIYWSFIIELQRFAEEIVKGHPAEDVLTGRLTGYLNKQLTDWGRPNLEELGYPDAKAVLEFVHTAGVGAEAATGADIGIVINIDVGGLKVAKVALLQAKISRSGVADVGSKRSGKAELTQLQKLCDSSRDYYLLYHVASGPSLPMLPTVTAASHFRKGLDQNNAVLESEHLAVDTREVGWDLASFITFGLCTSGSSIGKVVPAGANPLDVLTENGAASLPRYVLVVSLTDDDREFEPVLQSLRDISAKLKQPDVELDVELEGRSYHPDLGHEM